MLLLTRAGSRTTQSPSSPFPNGPVPVLLADTFYDTPLSSPTATPRERNLKYLGFDAEGFIKEAPGVSTADHGPWGGGGRL